MKSKCLVLMFAALTFASTVAGDIGIGPNVTARRIIRGASLPTTCSISDVFFKTAATVGSYECKTANTWTLIGGGGTGDALTTDPLSQFAATTSAQFATVITNESGTGLVVFGTNATHVTPTIASFVNSAHDHDDAAGGGLLTGAALGSFTSNLSLNNVTAQPSSDVMAATFRRNSGAQTANVLEIQTEANALLAAFNKAGALILAGSTSGSATLQPTAIAGSPVFTLQSVTGTIYSTGGVDIAVADGGTGSSSASDARTALGLAIGTDVEAFDADLLAIAALISAADNLPYATGAQAWALTGLSAAGRAILDDADATAQRVTLGLAIGTNVQAFDADLTTYAGIAPSANVQTLLGSADNSAIRSNTGLAIGTNVEAWDADLDTLAGKTIPSGATLADTSSAQTLTGPKTLTAPVVADFTAAAHDHGDADDGGQLTTAALSDYTAPTAVAFSAGNFTSDSGSWTVDSGDQTEFSFTLIGKTMVVIYRIETTDVGGTPTFLRITLPLSKTASRSILSNGNISTNATVLSTASWQTVAGQPYVYLSPAANGGTWSTTTSDDTSVTGVAVLFVN